MHFQRKFDFSDREGKSTPGRGCFIILSLSLSVSLSLSIVLKKHAYLYSPSLGIDVVEGSVLSTRANSPLTANKLDRPAMDLKCVFLY
jgi:hypothetical protein